MKLKLLAFILMFAFAANAQIDTVWIDKKGNSVAESMAAYYSICYTTDTPFHKQIFFASNGQLHMDGYFHNQVAANRVGVFKWYSEQGKLTDSIEYRNGQPWRTRHFYLNGRTKTYLAYNIYGQATDVNSWYADGRQKDCDTFYIDAKSGDCGADTALQKGIIKKEGEKWHLCFYYLPSGKISMDGHFKERLCKTRVGIDRWYFETGQLKDSMVYVAGKPTAKYTYNIDGSPKKLMAMDEKGNITAEKTWDSAGKEVTEDTLFLNKNKKPCKRDQAIYYKIFTKMADLWKMNIYNIATGAMAEDALYKNKSDGHPYVYLKRYHTNGLVIDSILYDKGIMLAEYRFYNNGAKKEASVRDTARKTEVTTTWDETGKLITADSSGIVWAQPVGGWPMLYQALNKMLDTCAASYKQRKDLNGILKYSFSIDAQGKASHFVLQQSSGSGVIDTCIASKLEDYNWKPRTNNGQVLLFPITYKFLIIEGKVK